MLFILRTGISSRVLENTLDDLRSDGICFGSLIHAPYLGTCNENKEGEKKSKR